MEIECKFIADFWQCGKFEKPEEVQTCIVKSIEIKQRGTEIKSIKGVHAYQLQNVRGLEITNTTSEYFPRGLSQLFPNLQFIQLSNCGLKEISKRDLSGLEKLKILRLSNNKLMSLPDNLFADMKQLKIIDFSNNQLEHLTSKLLEPVQDSLTFANFRSNTKVDAIFEKHSEQTLIRLMSIIDKSCPPSAASLEVQQETFEKVQSRVEKFEKMFEKGKYSDLTIETADKSFKVHKCILAAQSSVLKKKIKEKFEKSHDGVITIKSFSSEVVQDFLHYLYCGNISSGENFIELLGMALFYEVEELETHCENIIIKNLDETNAFDVFCLGIEVSSEKLKRSAFEELKKDHFLITEKMYEYPRQVNCIVTGYEDSTMFTSESVRKLSKIKLPPKKEKSKKLFKKDGKEILTELAAQGVAGIVVAALTAIIKG